MNRRKGEISRTLLTEIVCKFQFYKLVELLRVFNLLATADVSVLCACSDSLSPSSLRKRIADMIRGSSGRKQSINLEVPQQFFIYSSSPESSDNESDLRITVPKKTTSSQRHKRASSPSKQSPGDVNVVAPWDNAET